MKRARYWQSTCWRTARCGPCQQSISGLRLGACRISRDYLAVDLGVVRVRRNLQRWVAPQLLGGIQWRCDILMAAFVTTVGGSSFPARRSGVRRRGARITRLPRRPVDESSRSWCQEKLNTYYPGQAARPCLLAVSTRAVEQATINCRPGPVNRLRGEPDVPARTRQGAHCPHAGTALHHCMPGGFVPNHDDPSRLAHQAKPPRPLAVAEIL
jgi:hypothetical protein